MEKELTNTKVLTGSAKLSIGEIKRKSENAMTPDKKKSQSKTLKCTDLNYLIQCTKANPATMVEMISLYLEQTPPLINIMKQSVTNADWASLRTAVHKMIPSFLIMGISADFENMAKKVQEYAVTKKHTDQIPDLVRQLERVCTQACEELEIEFIRLKETSHEK